MGDSRFVCVLFRTPFLYAAIPPCQTMPHKRSAVVPETLEQYDVYLQFQPQSRPEV